MKSAEEPIREEILEITNRVRTLIKNVVNTVQTSYIRDLAAAETDASEAEVYKEIAQIVEAACAIIDETCDWATDQYVNKQPHSSAPLPP